MKSPLGLSLLIVLAVAWPAFGSSDRLDIVGDYLLFSFDHNFIFGQGHLSLNGRGWKIQGTQADIDVSSKRAWISGPCQVTFGLRSSAADLVEVNLEDASLSLFRFADKIELERLPEGQQPQAPTAGLSLPALPPREKLLQSLH